MIEIDGNFGESGGQILRYALALSVYTGRPFKITEIRKNRPQGGLKAQHLTCIDLLKHLSDTLKKLNYWILYTSTIRKVTTS